jgi:hypothetical protein
MAWWYSFAERFAALFDESASAVGVEVMAILGGSGPAAAALSNPSWPTSQNAVRAGAKCEILKVKASNTGKIMFGFATSGRERSNFSNYRHRATMSWARRPEFAPYESWPVSRRTANLAQ